MFFFFELLFMPHCRLPRRQRMLSLPRRRHAAADTPLTLFRYAMLLLRRRHAPYAADTRARLRRYAMLIAP